MRNSRRLVGGLVLALMMSTALSADTGAPGGAKRDTCGFLQGILYKIGTPDSLAVIFESVFGCDF
jgi:hypothetical protein